MKNILLLGGFGFLGINILNHIDLYKSKDYQVLVFDRYEKHPMGLQFDCNIKTVSGDFSDRNALEHVFKQEKIDLVIHAISTTLPALPFSARFDIESNLIPTVELLNIMVKYNVSDIVYISSGGAVYGSSPNRHKETDNLFPISSYGIVKLAIEKYLFQYAALYRLNPLVLRLSNPYGKYHFSQKQGICNVALRAAIYNNQFVVWGDGNAKKDYIFVEDFTHILFSLLEKNVFSEIINIGSGCVLSVNDILHAIQNRISGFKWSYTDASLFDVHNFELNTNKLKSYIGEYAFTPFNQGLAITIDWLENENK
jgi:UDP-glucose 4-epimerase